MEEDAEKFDCPCPNLATEDTYGDGGEDDVRGRREDGVGEVTTAKRFVPASSRASGGARVCARVEEEIMTGVRCVFIETGTTQHYYAGAPSGSHLRDMWRTCNTLEVVPCSHARLDCRVVVPASPGFKQ